MGEKMIEVQGVTKSFGDLLVLKGIDLVIYKGADKLIDLVNTEKAYMCFALGVDATAECTVEDNGEMLIAKSDNLSIETFVAPKDFNTYIKDAKGYTDGIEY
jgi:hypothetical protein